MNNLGARYIEENSAQASGINVSFPSSSQESAQHHYQTDFSPLSLQHASIELPIRVCNNTSNSVQTLYRINDNHDADLRPVIPQEMNHLRKKISGLTSLGFPAGLASLLVSTNSNIIAQRVWIVDNSGSMSTPYGQNLLVGKSLTDQYTNKVTRWEELKSCLSSHIDILSLLEVKTEFRVRFHEV